MIEILKNAIRNRSEISFTYSGIARERYPAAVGVSRKGNEVLRIFQTEGGHINPDHDWDLCCIDELSNVELTGKTFDSDPPHYKQGDKGMIEIYEQL